MHWFFCHSGSLKWWYWQLEEYKGEFSLYCWFCLHSNFEKHVIHLKQYQSLSWIQRPVCPEIARSHVLTFKTFSPPLIFSLHHFCVQIKGGHWLFTLHLHLGFMLSDLNVEYFSLNSQLYKITLEKLLLWFEATLSKKTTNQHKLHAWGFKAVIWNSVHTCCWCSLVV